LGLKLLGFTFNEIGDLIGGVSQSAANQRFQRATLDLARALKTALKLPHYSHGIALALREYFTGRPQQKQELLLSELYFDELSEEEQLGQNGIAYLPTGGVIVTRDYLEKQQRKIP